jgi:hypothetical protein
MDNTRLKRLPILIAAATVLGCNLAQVPTSTSAPAPTASETAAPVPTETAVPSPTNEVLENVSETLNLLQSEEVPSADPIDLARRLNGLTGEVPESLDPPAAPFQVGAHQIFRASDQDAVEQFDVNATLQYVTDHAYFWVQDSVPYAEADLMRLAIAFENGIYPTTREFFGSESTPGIDGDPHIYIVYASGLGESIAGYFSSVDSLHPLVREDSNAHEMFFFNADTVGLDEFFTYGLLAHEFQHMIHSNTDKNETSWVDEGLSELAFDLNGFGKAFRHPVYTENPDLSLNDWNPDDRGPHYAAASLFMTYFLDRFGKNLVQDMVAHPANGLEGIDLVFEAADLTDPLSAELIRADEAVRDWVIANFLNDNSLVDGRFGYSDFRDLSRPEQTETLASCEADGNERQVNQYGVHYISVICEGQRTVEFDGADETQVLAVDPFSGDYSFWSNKGDTSDMRLTRGFDFTDVSGPINLTFQTWFDIEADWDYIFLLASLDDGATWEIIQTPSGTDSDPNGNSFGWGYTSMTPDSKWIEETVDLSHYAGEEILLRFEYITDAAVNGEGMMIDDISIPEIGYFTDFEADDGGWESEGWARITNELPQSFELAWISVGDEAKVEYIPIGANNTASIPIDVSEDGAGVLVILPTTRFTRQPARYTLSFTE